MATPLAFFDRQAERFLRRVAKPVSVLGQVDQSGLPGVLDPYFDHTMRGRPIALGVAGVAVASESWYTV